MYGRVGAHDNKDHDGTRLVGGAVHLGTTGRTGFDVGEDTRVTPHTEISTAARSIAREHNKRVRAGFGGSGRLVFGRDGSGGAWYSDGSYGFGSDVVIVPMRWGTISAADAQEILDAQN